MCSAAPATTGLENRTMKNMKPYRPEALFIEEAVRDSRITRTVRDRLAGVPVKMIDSSEALLEAARRDNPTLPRAKKSLLLAAHKGRFFKPCPGSQTRGTVENACCDYFVINYASNCHMECSYCYLQSYLNFPYMIVYANVDELLQELHTVFTGQPDRLFRVGTGELADSLALDPLTGYSRPLVEFFARQTNAVLELKTKSDCVENLMKIKHGERTVVSWSLNPRFIQKQEEHKTATIEQRLQAATRCAEKGYPIAFHLDPMIHYPKWEEEYRDLIQEIFRRLPARSVRWISLGTLRMHPSLRNLIRRRFPSSILPLGELVPTEDSKLRYFKAIRVEMFRKAMSWIREQSNDTSVYACMEKPEIWNKAFQLQPPPERELGDSLVQMVL